MGEAIGNNTFRVTDVSLTIGEPNRYYLAPAEHESFRASFLAKFPDAGQFGLIGSWHSRIHFLRTEGAPGEAEPSLIFMATPLVKTTRNGGTWNTSGERN